MNLIEKDLLRLPSVKMVLYNHLEHILQNKFADCSLSLTGHHLEVNVELFESVSDYLKNIAFKKIQQIQNDFTPNLNLKTVFYKTKTPQLKPKFYHLLFENKFKRYKTPPFSYINKLENLTIPPEFKGLYIRVKGKRGARKSFKIYKTGVIPCHGNHGKLKTYKGTVESSMGTTGIIVRCMFK